MSQQGHSDYIVFLDECGDHSLQKIDKDFPLFLLSLVLVKRDDYANLILPTINQLKLRYWDHEGINLHSRDIRKKAGPFAILNNASLREQFMEELTAVIASFPFELFVVGIDKQKLCRQYRDAKNPYDLAMTFAMERIVPCMQERKQATLPIIAEARGKKEDDSLKATFFDLLSCGTNYISSSQFQQVHYPLLFHDKRKNIAGIQLADLCAYPSARHILNPDQPNRAYEIV